MSEPRLYATDELAEAHARGYREGLERAAVAIAELAEGGLVVTVKEACERIRVEANPVPLEAS